VQRTHLQLVKRALGVFGLIVRLFAIYGQHVDLPWRLFARCLWHPPRAPAACAYSASSSCDSITSLRGKALIFDPQLLVRANSSFVTLVVNPRRSACRPRYTFLGSA
jgi:hypothetical protein